MEINFDKFRIRRFDASNIVIEQLKKIQITIDNKKTGEIKNDWVVLSYHGTLRNALKNLVDVKLSNEDYKSINQVLEDIERLKKFIEKLEIKENENN